MGQRETYGGQPAGHGKLSLERLNSSREKEETEGKKNHDEIDDLKGGKRRGKKRKKLGSGHTAARRGRE